MLTITCSSLSIFLSLRINLRQENTSVDRLWWIQALNFWNITFYHKLFRSFQFYVYDYLQNRENNSDVIVLITRATPNDRDVALSEAEGFLSRPIKLITVGVHSGSSAPYLGAFLREMNNYTSFLSKYKDLERNRKAVLDEICRVLPGGKYPYKNSFSRDEDEYLT